MKKLMIWASALSLVCIWSCSQQEESIQPQQQEVPQQIINQLNAAGFNTTDFDVTKLENGYIVEKDILLTEQEIAHLAKAQHIPSVEHYNTDNLVSGTPRTVNVYVDMPQKYKDATDIAIDRYNDESLLLEFQRVSSAGSADITITASPFYYYFFGILGSSGFPTSGGDPYDEILMTRAYYDNISNINGLASTIAHEMGHCIGFRHTDYMDRSYSCGGSTDDEGDGGVGANHIPGTPTGPDADSWMLACGDPEVNRPFTSNDQIALDYLY